MWTLSLEINSCFVFILLAISFEMVSGISLKDSSHLDEYFFGREKGF